MSGDRHVIDTAHPLHAADVIAVVMREPDCGQAPARLADDRIDDLAQRAELIVPRRARVDQREVFVSDQQGVGVRRGRERRRSQGNDPNCRTELDRFRRIGLAAVKFRQARQSVFHAVRGEDAQGLERRLREQRFARRPAAYGDRGPRPFAGDQLAGNDGRLQRFFERPLQQEKRRIEAHPRQRRRYPTPGVAQARAIQMQGMLPEPRGEIQAVREQFFLGRRQGRRPAAGRRVRRASPFLRKARGARMTDGPPPDRSGDKSAHREAPRPAGRPRRNPPSARRGRHASRP